MHSKLLVSLLAAALLVPAVLQAQTPGATRPAPSAVQTEMAAIVKNVRQKLKEQQGKATAADLADDFKAFDALIAKHAGEKTDDVAQVCYMKAMLYEQVLGDKATAEKVIKQMKEDFKGTKFMANLERQQAMKAETSRPAWRRGCRSRTSTRRTWPASRCPSAASRARWCSWISGPRGAAPACTNCRM